MPSRTLQAVKSISRRWARHVAKMSKLETQNFGVKTFWKSATWKTENEMERQY